MFKENQTPTDSKTVIGASVNVEGDFKGQGDVIIEGRLKGSLATEHDITISNKADVVASINANNVYISGKVKGNTEAKGHVQLASTASVNGDIKAGTISIETGAIFNGHCGTKINESIVKTLDNKTNEQAK